MRLSHRLIVFPLTAVLLLSLVVFAAPVSANPANPGFKVTEARLLTDIAPGEIITHRMTVSIGEEGSALDVLVEVRGLGQLPDKTYRVLDDAEDTSPYSARPFITLDRTSFRLEPGDSQEVTATITIPKDIGAGGRYALIHFHSRPIGEGLVGIVAAVAVPVMLTIADTEIIQTGTITDLSVSDVVTGQPIVVSTTLKHTGNHHYRKVQNEVRLTDERGNEIAIVSPPPSIFAIIPAHSVQFNVVLDQELAAGRYYVHSKATLADGTLLDKRSTSFEVTEPYVPPPPPAKILLTPGRADVLETEDGRFSTSFPIGAVLAPVEIILRSYPLERLPDPPSNYGIAATSFRIDGLPGLLAQKATVTVKYIPADLAKAEGDATRLRLARWDEVRNQWSVLETKVDPEAMTLSTRTDRLSIWAVMVAPPTVVNWPLIGSVVAGIIIIALLLAYFLAIKRRSYSSSPQDNSRG